MHPYSTFTDINVFKKFEELIKKHSIKTIFETGTHGGITSKILSHYVDKVITVDIKQWQRTVDRLSSIGNIDYHIGDSADKIKELCEDNHQHILFFLDAHTPEESRILDELDEIANKNIKPIIIVHDFKVPHNLFFTNDKHKGEDLSLELIQDKLDKIYGKNGFVHEYSKEFDFHNPFVYLDIDDHWESIFGDFVDPRHTTAPGVIYIEPKEL